MIPSKSLNEYYVNEFAIDSEIPLPYDQQLRPGCPVPNGDRITLRRASLADVPCLLRKLRRQLIYDVGDGFLIEPKNLSVHIDFKGTTLTLDCADEHVLRAVGWAFHAGIGAATVTHGGIPLHGAGIEIAGKYVALMADSGYGKSTLSWFLIARGARFGNDDLIPVYLRGGEAVAYPSISMYPKLSREAVDRHGLDHAALRQADHGTDEEEYYAPVTPEQRIPAPAPLAAVFLLHPRHLGFNGLLQAPPMREIVTASRLPEDKAAAMFETNLHAVWLIGKWIDKRRIAALCRELAARVPVWGLSYPRAYALLPSIEAAIRRALEE